jgi:hypothetical protein
MVVCHSMKKHMEKKPIETLKSPKNWLLSSTTHDLKYPRDFDVPLCPATLVAQSLIPTDGSPMPRHLRGELETMLRRLFRAWA